LPAVALVRAEQFFYEESFVVPHAGVFSYRGEAEDFWENTSSDPDSGWHAFATEGFSDAESPSILPPSSFVLSAFPNPFNPSTTLTFSLPKAGQATLLVYDISGRHVNTLVDERLTAGEHHVTFDGRGLPSGIYFAHLQAGAATRTQKLVVIK
jgi:hypothetical protein